jgi:hypothetical protein
MLVHETFTFSLNKDNMPAAFAYDYHNQRWTMGGSNAEGGVAKEEEGEEATPKGGLSKRAKKMLLKKKEEKQEELSSNLVATGAIEVGTIVRFVLTMLIALLTLLTNLNLLIQQSANPNNYADPSKPIDINNSDNAVRFKVVKLDLADRVYSWHGSIVEKGMGAIGFKARPVPIELTGYA